MLMHCNDEGKSKEEVEPGYVGLSQVLVDNERDIFEMRRPLRDGAFDARGRGGPGFIKYVGDRVSENDVMYDRRMALMQLDMYTQRQRYLAGYGYGLSMIGRTLKDDHQMWNEYQQRAQYVDQRLGDYAFELQMGVPKGVAVDRGVSNRTFAFGPRVVHRGCDCVNGPYPEHDEMFTELSPVNRKRHINEAKKENATSHIFTRTELRDPLNRQMNGSAFPRVENQKMMPESSTSHMTRISRVFSEVTKCIQMQALNWSYASTCVRSEDDDSDTTVIATGPSLCENAC